MPRPHSNLEAERFPEDIAKHCPRCGKAHRAKRREHCEQCHEDLYGLNFLAQPPETRTPEQTQRALDHLNTEKPPKPKRTTCINCGDPLPEGRTRTRDAICEASSNLHLMASPRWDLNSYTTALPPAVRKAEEPLNTTAFPRRTPYQKEPE